MKINFYSIKDDIQIIDKLKQGLEKINEPHILKNYHPDYENESGNLFYIIQKGRFDIGNYYVMLNEYDEYIGSAGWNEYTTDIALILVRSFVLKKYRTNHYIGHYIFPKILSDTINYTHRYATFNEYNKLIYDAMVRIKNNKMHSLFPWLEIYKKFNPIGQQMINNTLQYVAEYHG